MIQDNLKPKIKPYDKDEYILTQDFKFVDKGLKLHLTVKAGTKFDGASIPRFLWSTTGSPFMPQYVGPALVHDIVYRRKMDDHRDVSRKEADLIFKVLLKRNYVNAYQSNKMHLAVRSFGWKYWSK